MSYGSKPQPRLYKKNCEKKLLEKFLCPMDLILSQAFLIFFFENEKNSMSYGSKPQPSLSKKNSEKNLKKFLCPTTKPSEAFIKKN